jgi:hypothetical protein
MTLEIFKRMMQTESENPEDLLSLLENAWSKGMVDMLQYADIKSDIHLQYHHLLLQIKEHAILKMKLDILEESKEKNVLEEQILKNIKRR